MPRLLLLVVILISGCDPLSVSLPSPPVPASYPDYASVFTTGTVAGQVQWRGEAPAVPPLMGPRSYWRFEAIPNPHAPAIDAASGGLAGAVVVLEGPFPAAKPWPHPPAEVRLLPGGLQIVQGDRAGRVGFVRVGDAVRVCAEGGKLQGLRARGDAFFGIMLPPTVASVERRLPHRGVVRLSSASGQFWSHGELFVLDHPYAAITDAQGRFTLDGVPPGDYDLVLHHPSWHEAGREIDPESGLLARMAFAAPLVQRQRVTIAAGQTRETIIAISKSDFATSR